jgi:hypothetical protein
VRRLYAAAAAQGHAESKLVLERLANHAADALMMAEEATSKPAKAKSKSRKGKGHAKPEQEDDVELPPHRSPNVEPSSVASGGGVSSEAPGTSAGTYADAALISAADDALRAAMADGAYEAVSAALEAHRATASEAVIGEARVMRDKLRERRKKQSQKQRRAHAGAMQALATLQSAQDKLDADTLHVALESAAGHEGELPALQDEVSSAQGLLASLSLDVSQAAPAAPRVVELSPDELSAATDQFTAQRVVGMGGFGQVYVADAIPSLVQAAGRLAVKRASAGLDLQDLLGEVKILQACEHAHLMPLYGYCVDTVAPCLVFPLMVGGACAATPRPH